MSDTALRWISSAVALGVNGLLFAGMAFAGFSAELPKKAGDQAFEMVDVDLVDFNLGALPKLGVPLDDRALPRIVEEPVAATPDPMPNEDEIQNSHLEPVADNGPSDALEVAPEPAVGEEVVNLARKKATEEEEEAVRKAEEARKKAEEKARKRAEKKEREARERQARMARAMGAVLDPRADMEDAPIGVPDGYVYGTSTDPNALSNQSAYVSLVSLQIQRQLKVPSVLSPEERRRLQVEVHFFLDANGKVKGDPKLMKSSGNRFLDDAALRAVRVFGKEGELSLGLPKQASLKKWVLKEGIRAVIKCAR